MERLPRYSALIEQAINSLNLPSGTLSGLYEPIAYGLDTGGKRLRPLLALIAGTSMNASIEQVMPAALAIEMFHNFTLIHDDVMDNSDTRRGKPSVRKQWDVNTAILSGDTLYGLAYNQILKLPDYCLHQALKCFNDTAIGVFEGQQYDMDFEKRNDVSLPEYIEMIRLKTSVLLGGAAMLGAIAAGASDSEAKAWYNYGESLGLAFQIQDDLLDVYGDPATFGKPIGGDILNSKKTFLTLSALSTNAADDLQKALEMPPSETKITIVRNIYDSIDIQSVCNKAIEKYTTQAVASLDEIPLQDNDREMLTTLAQKLAHRNK